MRRQSTLEPGTRPLHSIGIYTADPDLDHEAKTLAAQTDLPIIRNKSHVETALILSHSGLSLARPNDLKMTGTVQVDFSKGAWKRRIKWVREERLVKAMGKKTLKSAGIIDLTGGLGRDSFLLAAAGFSVRTFERNPVLAALLTDGLRRASLQTATREICGRIHFTPGNAIDFLGTGEATAEIIYLDPMFPKTTSTAKVKKELQMIQHVTGEDQDIDTLFALALQAAGERVVVKRPKKGPWLNDIRPAYSLEGKTIRFDVYLNRSLAP
ncbi:MAG: class I SAM-dependent methyltransferase [Desulfobulbaceae bacterium]|nr:class I SAM-dependent methyltransferase [Desulfobulbaceae bacterium]